MNAQGKVSFRPAIPTILLALLALPGLAAAQQPAPIVVVSVKPIDHLLTDVTGLLDAVDAKDQSQQLKAIADQMLGGIDRSRPLGVALFFGAEGPQPLAFVPVTDGATIRALLGQMLGGVKDSGGGVWQIGDPGQAYFKEQDAWMFVSNSPAALASLPKDPQKLLGDMPTKYDLSTKLLAKNVPPPLIDALLPEVKKMIPAEGGDPSLQMMAGMMDQLGPIVKTALGELDSINSGINIDGSTGELTLEWSVLGRQGSRLATWCNALQSNHSQLSGLRSRVADISLNLTFSVDQQMAQGLLAMAKMQMQGQLAALQGIPGLNDEQKRQQQQQAQMSLAMLEAMFKNGKVDLGVAGVIRPKGSVLVFGAAVSDAAPVKRAFRDLYQVIKTNPAISDLKASTIDYKGARFLTLQSKTMAQALQQASQQASPEGGLDLFDDDPALVMGVHDKAYYVAFGADPMRVLPRIHDRCLQGVGKPVAPIEVAMNVGPFVKLAPPLPGAGEAEKLVREMLEKAKGKTRLTLASQTLQNGVGLRLRLDPVLLQVLLKVTLQEMAKQQQAAAGAEF